jgi:hypothetical protein
MINRNQLFKRSTTIQRAAPSTHSIRQDRNTQHINYCGLHLKCCFSSPKAVRKNLNSWLLPSTANLSETCDFSGLGTTGAAREAR